MNSAYIIAPTRILDDKQTESLENAITSLYASKKLPSNIFFISELEDIEPKSIYFKIKEQLHDNFVPFIVVPMDTTYGNLPEGFWDWFELLFENYQRIEKKSDNENSNDL